MMPLKWAVGDRAAVRRDDTVLVGTVESIGPDCAVLKINEWRNVFCGLDELELVPFAIASNEGNEEQHGTVEHLDSRNGRAPQQEAAGGREPDGGGLRPSAQGEGAHGHEGDDHVRRRGGRHERGPDGGSEALGRVTEAPDYGAFVAKKLTRAPSTGLSQLPELHASLFPFQRDLVSWALRRGRCALFADTGLGKTAMQLEWARHISERVGDVLILAPLAVASQTVREGERLGVALKHCRSDSDVEPGISITNYDRLHRFDPKRFVGIVLDESSIIKHHDAKTFAILIEAFRDTPFKLAATATPSPNDFTELGTHAEFLGVCTRQEMLAEYFVHDGGSTQDWRLKGHARGHFWRWVATWSALLRKPSDLGYEDGGYELPELRVAQHTIEADVAEINKAAEGQTSLFAEPAKTLTERRAARKGSLSERVRRCAETVLAEPGETWVVWCELNAEADALSSAIPGSVEIRGSDEPLLKEGRLVAFARGEFKVLITKPSIAGFGLNWQHAARMAFVGVKDSWEAYYQAIRREWRFGQKRPVQVHIFASELEGAVVKNLQRKERDAIAMAEQLSAETREAVRAEVRGSTRSTNDYLPAVAMTRPAWLASDDGGDDERAA